MSSHNHSLGLTSPDKIGFTYGPRVDATEDGREWVEAAEQHGYKTFRIDEEGSLEIYGLLKSGIAPQHIALVASVSETGVGNLAPFSSFLQCSADPPIVSFSASRHPRYKDTLANIKATKGYTINVVSEPWVEQANMASVDPKGVIEWDLGGLTKDQSTYVKAPRVKESAFVVELEFLQDADIFKPETGEVASTTIFGKVMAIHVRNDMFDARGFLHPGKLRPITKLNTVLDTSTEDYIGEAITDSRV